MIARPIIRPGICTKSAERGEALSDRRSSASTLLAGQLNLDRATYEEYARALGLDLARFQHVLDTGRRSRRLSSTSRRRGPSGWLSIQWLPIQWSLLHRTAAFPRICSRGKSSLPRTGCPIISLRRPLSWRRSVERETHRGDADLAPRPAARRYGVVGSSDRGTTPGARRSLCRARRRD